MLTGIKGIFEKIMKVAAPAIGGSMFGAPGAMFGSGVASLISGDKPQDALKNAVLSAVAGYRGADNTSMIDRMTQSGPVQDTIQRNRMNTYIDPKKRSPNKSNFLFDLFKERGSDDNPKPSFGMQALSTGLPAYLSYLAAKEDAKKPGPADPGEYMSSVDKMYGGQFERPPEERPKSRFPRVTRQRRPLRPGPRPNPRPGPNLRCVRAKSSFRARGGTSRRS